MDEIKVPSIGMNSVVYMQGLGDLTLEEENMTSHGQRYFKGIVSDSNNIFLWRKLVDDNEKG